MRSDFTYGPAGRVFVTHDYVVYPTFYQGRKKNVGYGYMDSALKAKKMDAVIKSLRVEIARDFPESP